METLIIQVDCRRYSRDGPPQLGITVEAPFSQRNALQQKKQQQYIQQQNQHQKYQNHDYQNLDGDSFGLTNTRPNGNTVFNFCQTTKASPLVKQQQNKVGVYNRAQQVHEGLQITQIQKGSVIDRVGQFRVGDIIVEVNGVNLQRPFPEAQRTLKQFVVDHTSHGPLILKVLRKSASSSSIPSTTGSQVTVIEQDATAKRQTSVPKVTGGTPISKQAQHTLPPSQSPTSPKSTSSRTSRHLVGALNTRKIGVKHTIRLRKAANGFGIKIAERDNMHSSRNRPIYITAITTTGSAYSDGRLREGDMLLEVNGIDIQTKTQPEVTKMLKSVKADEEVEFVVSRQEDLPVDESQGIRDDSVSSTNRTSIENNCDKSLIDLDAPDHEDSVFVESISDVQFERKIDSILNVPIIDGPGVYIYDIPLNDTKSAGLGLYLKYPCRADERRDLGIWIEKVITGGAAWKDGRLQPDDQILAINGIDLVGLSNSEASETLTAAVCRGIGPDATLNTIRLSIHRRSPSVVAKILQGTNNRIECSDVVSNSKSLTDDKNVDSSRESYQTAFNTTLLDKASETRNSSGSSNHNSQNDSAMSPQTQASNSLKLTNSCNDRSDRSSSDKTNDTTSSAISQITDSTNHVPNNVFLSSARGNNPRYVSNDHFTTKPSMNQNSDSLKATKPKSIRTGDDGSEMQTLDYESSSQSWDDESVDAANYEDRFQRDGFGRQSISEKRHAQLNAKNTDTFRRSQKVREEREQQRMLEERMSRQRLEDDNSTTNCYPPNDNNRLPTSYTTNEFKSIYGLQTHQEPPVRHERLVCDMNTLQTTEQRSMNGYHTLPSAGRTQVSIPPGCVKSSEDEPALDDKHKTKKKKKFPVTWLRNHYPFKSYLAGSGRSKHKPPPDDQSGQYSSQSYDMLNPNPSTWARNPDRSTASIKFNKQAQTTAAETQLPPPTSLMGTPGLDAFMAPAGSQMAFQGGQQSIMPGMAAGGLPFAPHTVQRPYMRPTAGAVPPTGGMMTNESQDSYANSGTGSRQVATMARAPCYDGGEQSVGFSLSLGNGRSISLGGSRAGAMQISRNAGQSGQTDHTVAVSGYSKTKVGGYQHQASGGSSYSSSGSSHGDGYVNKHPTMYVDVPRKDKKIVQASLNTVPLKVRLNSIPCAKITTGSREPLEKLVDEALTEQEENIFEPSLKKNATATANKSDTSGNGTMANGLAGGGSNMTTLNLSNLTPYPPKGYGTGSKHYFGPSGGGQSHFSQQSIYGHYHQQRQASGNQQVYHQGQAPFDVGHPQQGSVGGYSHQPFDHNQAPHYQQHGHLHQSAAGQWRPPVLAASQQIDYPRQPQQFNQQVPFDEPSHFAQQQQERVLGAGQPGNYPQQQKQQQQPGYQVFTPNEGPPLRSPIQTMPRQPLVEQQQQPMLPPEMQQQMNFIGNDSRPLTNQWRHSSRDARLQMQTPQYHYNHVRAATYGPVPSYQYPVHGSQQPQQIYYYDL